MWLGNSKLMAIIRNMTMYFTSNILKPRIRRSREQTQNSSHVHWSGQTFGPTSIMQKRFCFCDFLCYVEYSYSGCQTVKIHCFAPDASTP